MSTLRDEAVKALKVCQASDDIEVAHSNADDILCKLLNELGFEDVVAEYEEVDKWFA